MELIHFFENSNDSASLALNLIHLSNSYLEMKETGSALEANLRADSILEHIGFYETRLKNKINLMNIHNMLGDTISRNNIVRELLTDHNHDNNLKFYVALAMNTYSYLGDATYLKEAYNRIQKMPSMASCTAIVEAELARMHIDSHNLDSAAIYAYKAFDKIPLVKDNSHKSEIYRVMSDLCEKQGRIKDALEYYKKMKECNDSFINESNPVDFIKKRYQMDMSNIRIQAQHKSKETQLNWIICVFSIGLALAILIINLLVRSIRLKNQMRHAMIERDRSYRKAAVTMLSVAEKEKHLKDMESRIASCRDEGKISEHNAQQLISALKVNMADSSDWNNFAEYFSALHPQFEQKLKTDYPTLTARQIQLCSYIKMGFDTQRIAQIMHVKPETIWQSKWRIRQKMNLDSDDKLSVLIAGID